MFSLMCSIMMISIIPTVLMIVCSIVSKKSVLDREKSSPFECGFDPMSGSRIPFSLRFFLLTLIFLVFDVEITLILPILSQFLLSNTSVWLGTSIVFIGILLWGLYHEWYLGSLEWVE